MVAGDNVLHFQQRRLAGVEVGAEGVAGDPLGDQPSRVFLARRLQDLVGGAVLDHLAVAQHHDVVGDLRDHREIVGDVDRRRAVLANQFSERCQHLDLRGDVEGGRRLVKDQNVGLRRHRHRRHRPLQLPARDLMRIAVAERIGVRQFQRAEQLPRFRQRLRHRHQAVPHRDLAHLLHQRHRRVEAGGGALRDVGDAGAAQRAPLRRRHLADVAALEIEFSARHHAAAARVAERAQADRGFARARFADQPDHLAAPQLEADIVHQHRARALVGAHLDAQFFDVQDGLADAPPLAAHAPPPCAREWMDNIQSTTKFTPMVRIAIAPAGYSGAGASRLIMSR